jgi:acetyl esterase/lipase
VHGRANTGATPIGSCSWEAHSAPGWRRSRDSPATTPPSSRGSSRPTLPSRRLLIVHGDKDTLTSSRRARALAERARNASGNPVVCVELPGAEHSFDLLSSICFEAVIDGIEAFAAAVVADP